jgi:hypothetical protein
MNKKGNIFVAFNSQLTAADDFQSKVFSGQGDCIFLVIFSAEAFRSIFPFFYG